jgi:hypothetical protein
MQEPTMKEQRHLQDWHILVAIVVIAAATLTVGLLLDNGPEAPAPNRTATSTTVRP